MSKANQKDKYGTVHSYVGTGVEMDGVLKFEGALHLSGNYKGKIESNGFLVVGSTGLLNADIEIGDIENNGRINGNISCVNKVYFKKTSQVKGDITTRKLDIEDGAEFLGRCNMVFSDNSKSQGDVSKELSAPTTTVALPILDEGEKKSLFKGIWVSVFVVLLLVGGWFAYQKGYLDFTGKTFESYFQDAQESYLSGQYTESKELFKNALLVNPVSVEVHEWLADIAIKEKNSSEAEQYLTKAFELDGTNLTILDKLLALYGGTGNSDGIINIYQKKLSLMEDDVDTRQKYADLLKEQGNIEEAINQYEQIIKFSPTDIATLKMLATYYKENNKYFQVVETYRKIAQLEPTKIDNFLTLGRYLLTIGLENEANEAYAQVEMLDPDHIEVKNNEGFRLYNEGSYRRSKSVFNSVVKKEPKNVRGLLGLATNYSKTRSPNSAIKRAMEAIELEPNNASVLNRLAWSLAVSDRDVNDALAYSLQALAINPDVPEHIDTISEIYYRLGDYDKALSNIKRAIELDSEKDYYKSQKAKFEEALALKGRK